MICFFNVNSLWMYFKNVSVSSSYFSLALIALELDGICALSVGPQRCGASSRRSSTNKEKSIIITESDQTYILKTIVEVTDREWLSRPILQFKDLILDEGTRRCLVKDGSMEVFNSDLSDILVQRSPQSNDELKLIDSIKECSYRVIAKLL